MKACSRRGRPLQRERGLALLVSLILLVVSSLLAVAALSGARLSERISGNAQQKAIAFEAAESAVEQGFNRDRVLAALPASSTGSDMSVAIAIPDINTSLANDYDQSRTTHDGTTVRSVDVDGELTIQYCGEFVLPRGTDLSANIDDSARKAGLLFDINGVSNIAGSATRADHLQRGYVPGLATGRTGSCTSP